ncbi:MAG TPA: DUF2834 domain-containing protein [Candidatus Saccharimonadales bacterium]|nr:DUF2834 domain-containing protein [Candidatus Saccharimonadales bacterium]
MKAKHLYLLFCIIGIVVPYVPFAPFVHQHGLDLPLVYQQLFATPISSFFGLDVIVATLVLWIWVWIEGRRLRMERLWAPVLASLTVGVSLGLPLFLYMRERRMERANGD